MTERKNWKSRLAIRVNSPTEGEFVITPIESFNPGFSTPHDIVDSTEDQNLGYIRRPPRINFDMSVLAIGNAVQKLTSMQWAGEEFGIITQVAEPETEDWTFFEDGLVLSDCVITDSSPSNVIVDGVPRASFRGNALATQIAGNTISTYTSV